MERIENFDERMKNGAINTNKTIYIYMNDVTHKCKPYNEVRKLISEGYMDYIYTNCLDFFQFDMLEIYGYNVMVCSDEGYIDMSQLLVDSSYGVRKAIRLTHNLQKILKSGGFKFKKH